MSQTFIEPTGQPVARAGQLADMGADPEMISGFNAEPTMAMQFGTAVSRIASGPGRQFQNLAAGITSVAGILAYAYNHQPGTTGDLDGSGQLKGNAQLDVLTEGHVYVLVEEAVLPEDRPHVRVVASGANTTIGGFRKSADSTNSVDMTRQGKFLTAAPAGGLAVLEVDFTIRNS